VSVESAVSDCSLKFNHECIFIDQLEGIVAPQHVSKHIVVVHHVLDFGIQMHVFGDVQDVPHQYVDRGALESPLSRLAAESSDGIRKNVLLVLRREAVRLPEFGVADVAWPHHLEPLLALLLRTDELGLCHPLGQTLVVLQGVNLVADLQILTLGLGIGGEYAVGGDVHQRLVVAGGHAQDIG